MKIWLNIRDSYENILYLIPEKGQYFEKYYECLSERKEKNCDILRTREAKLVQIQAANPCFKQNELFSLEILTY